MPGVFDRQATPWGGMHRRPNAGVIMKRATKLAGEPIGFQLPGFSHQYRASCVC